VSLPSELDAERVLVLTPTGRDAAMVGERLVAAGYECQACGSLEELLAEIERGAGGAGGAPEALSQTGAEALLGKLDAQEPWSDVPILLLTLPASRSGPAHPAVLLFERANVTLLQRPLRLHLFLSAVRAAVRARRRQYQMRDLHRDLARAVELGNLFVSILGHDLRTPLSAIRVSAETIVRGSQEARALRPAGRIMTSADRMTRMIEQLLDLARVRQGRGLSLVLRPTHIGEICRQVVQEVEEANPHSTLELHESGDLSGHWDSDRLAQVVSNLVGNAVKHGAPGAPIVITVDGTDGVVRLRVQNRGVIHPEALPTLFEAFKQAGTSRTQRRGLGLGLFIAREIARAHGGDITVQVSEELTTFELVLPRYAPSGPTEQASTFHSP